MVIIKEIFFQLYQPEAALRQRSLNYAFVFLCSILWPHLTNWRNSLLSCSPHLQRAGCLANLLNCREKVRAIFLM